MIHEYCNQFTGNLIWREKKAIFSWESLYTDRVGGLANATTYLAQELAKKYDIHFFTREDKDFTFLGVHYHTVRPTGGNIIEYCNNMSHQMVSRLKEFDHPGFDILHFNDWHVIEALHLYRTGIPYSRIIQPNMGEMGTNMEIGGNIGRSQERSGMPV